MTSSLFVAIKNLQTLYWICKFVQPLDFVILNHMYSTACVCVTKDTRLFKIKFSMLKNNDYMYTIMFKWLPRWLIISPWYDNNTITFVTDTNVLVCIFCYILWKISNCIFTCEFWSWNNYQLRFTKLTLMAVLYNQL